MPVRITFQKTVIINHLVSEMSTAGYKIISYTPTWIEIEDSNDTAGVTAVYNATQPYYESDYDTALQQFLDQTAVDRGYQSEQDCLNGADSTDLNWQADAATMQTYDLYCHITLNGVFGYTGNTRLPGEQQVNPAPPPSIDEFLNSTLNSISW